MKYNLRRKIAAGLAAAMLLSAVTVSLSIVSFAATSSKVTGKSTAAKKKELSIGEVKKNVYVNDYFGLKLAVPDGFTFGDEAAVAEIDGSTEAFIKDKDAVIKTIKKGDPVTVAYADNEDNYDNINVTINLADVETDLKKQLEDSIPEVKNTLKEIGITPKEVSVVKAKVSGKDTYLLTTHGLISDEYDIYQKQYMGTEGDYTVCITFTSFARDDTDDMIKLLELD